MKIVKTGMIFAMIASVHMAASAESARLRLWLKDGSVRTKKIELERVTDKQCLFRLGKEQITDEIDKIDVIPDFMTAKKGDEGYWIDARGAYGFFTRDKGEYQNGQSGCMPIFALKRGDTLWYGHVKKWRCDYRFHVEAKDGEYAAYPRFNVEGVRAFYPVYQDIVVEFNRLTGKEADYIGYAKAYRKFQIGRGEVKPVKARVKDRPVLDYLTESFTIRLSVHARKQILKDRTMHMTRANEQPLIVHVPFALAGELMQQVHDAGVDKATVLSAGWTSGGYDGRYPDQFPVEIAAGGEAAFRNFAKRCRDIGFQFSAEVDYTEMYGPADRFDINLACKYANGDFPNGGFWPGGLAYNLCTKKALELGWFEKDFAKIAEITGPGPLFFDVMSAIEPRRCGNSGHIATAEEMGEAYKKLFALAHKNVGGAASECGFDFGIQYLDYVNYLFHEIGLFRRDKFKGFGDGVFPVWELVYHGIVFYTSDRCLQNHTFGGEDRTNGAFDFGWGIYDRKEKPENALKIIEFGGRPILYTHSFDDVPYIAKAWREYKPVRHLQKEEMTGHRTLAPDVYETSYEEGSKTVCNYNKTPYAADGFTVPPLGYVLLNPDSTKRFFAFDSEKGLVEISR